MPVVSALAITLAVLLWCPVNPVRRLRVTATASRPQGRPRLASLLALVVAAAIASGWVVDAARGAVLGFTLGVAGALAGWTVVRARRARRRNRMADQVARGCSELAALLRAGHPPGRALQLVAADDPVFAEPAAHAAVGGDLMAALQRMAERPGCRGLLGLAAAWRVAERTGASMTACLDELAIGLAAERELRRTVDTELAAPRLTGRLLGFLPAVGLILGYAVGGDPVGYLIGSPPGLVCLGSGISLAVAGVVWTEKLADRAGTLQ